MSAMKRPRLEKFHCENTIRTPLDVTFQNLLQHLSGEPECVKIHMKCNRSVLKRPSPQEEEEEEEEEKEEERRKEEGAGGVQEKQEPHTKDVGKNTKTMESYEPQVLSLIILKLIISLVQLPLTSSHLVVCSCH